MIINLINIYIMKNEYLKGQQLPATPLGLNLCEPIQSDGF